ncbi:hypothetical protein L2E82_15346 [Cichorium intybus]|uniref:Uncharacterized protein n=1 Tax=Cichorium intybus TaxID=13427 RepID=A0ACB9F301_CICIN|nr:hypothetical protein L2E82_15346 [Cichorium intybus]
MNLDRFWFGSPPDLVHDESRSDLVCTPPDLLVYCICQSLPPSILYLNELNSPTLSVYDFADLEAAMKSQGKQSICIEHKHKNTEINDLGLERDDSAYVLGKNVLPI